MKASVFKAVAVTFFLQFWEEGVIEDDSLLKYIYYFAFPGVQHVRGGGQDHLQYSNFHSPAAVICDDSADVATGVIDLFQFTPHCVRIVVIAQWQWPEISS